MEKINDEILAVIASALEANMKKSGMKLVVKSVERISGNKPVWNTTGRLERLSRRMNT
ncbi:MAG: sodium pump decarboxylase subunit gamma [Clostridiales bacterium]